MENVFDFQFSDDTKSSGFQFFRKILNVFRRGGGERKKTVFIDFRKTQWPSHPHWTQTFMTSYSQPPGPEPAVPKSCLLEKSHMPRYLLGASGLSDGAVVLQVEH